MTPQKTKPRSYTAPAATGIGLGAAIAVGISWSANHSVLWALFHAFCGWTYVIAYALGWVDQ